MSIGKSGEVYFCEGIDNKNPQVYIDPVKQNTNGKDAVNLK